MKNVPAIERAVRGVVAVLMVVGGGAWAWTGALLWGGLVAVSGAGLLATALTGWCPMCALVGRTLPKVDTKVPIARL